MGNRHIRINQKMTADELSKLNGGIRGQVIIGRGRHTVDYVDPYGKNATRSEFEEVLSVEENIVPIGGYQFVFSKLFNIGLDDNSTLRVGDLNDEAPQMKIGVTPGLYSCTDYNAECSITNTASVTKAGVNIQATNTIFGFIVGDGGAMEDNITAISPDYKRRTLYRALPFRMSNDGSPLVNGKYFGASDVQTSGTTETIRSYYVKKFDSPDPTIVHVWSSDSDNGELNIVDDSVFASTSSTVIESYVEMNMSIDQYDTRGFFTSNGSSTRVNEFGLVSGWYNPVKDDYEKIRLFTHFTRPSIALSEGDSIEIIYRLYAR